MSYVSIDVDIDDVIRDIDDDDLIDEVVKRYENLDKAEKSRLQKTVMGISDNKKMSLEDVLKHELFAESFDKFTLSELQQRLTKQSA
jgi:hypothetical protein